MANPNHVPDHVMHALRVYDRVVEEAQERVRLSLPDLSYKETLAEHMKLAAAAEQMCRSCFGNEYGFDAFDTEEGRRAVRWVSEAIGRRIHVPETRDERIAIAVDLWLARNR